MHISNAACFSLSLWLLSADTPPHSADTKVIWRRSVVIGRTPALALHNTPWNRAPCETGNTFVSCQCELPSAVLALAARVQINYLFSLPAASGQIPTSSPRANTQADVLTLSKAALVWSGLMGRSALDREPPRRPWTRCSNKNPTPSQVKSRGEHGSKMDMGRAALPTIQCSCKPAAAKDVDRLDHTAAAGLEVYAGSSKQT